MTRSGTERARDAQLNFQFPGQIKEKKLNAKVLRLRFKKFRCPKKVSESILSSFDIYLGGCNAAVDNCQRLGRWVSGRVSRAMPRHVSGKNLGSQLFGKEQALVASTNRRRNNGGKYDFRGTLKVPGDKSFM